MYHGKDAEDYRQAYQEGKEPDETPYGFHLAETLGYDVAFSRDAPPAPIDLRGRVLAKGLRVSSRRLGFDLVHAYNNRAGLRQADVIWTMTEGEAFATSLLCRLGRLPRRPLIANTIWLFDGSGPATVIQKNDVATSQPFYRCDDRPFPAMPTHYPPSTTSSALSADVFWDQHDPFQDNLAGGQAKSGAYQDFCPWQRQDPRLGNVAALLWQ